MLKASVYNVIELLMLAVAPANIQIRLIAEANEVRVKSILLSLKKGAFAPQAVEKVSAALFWSI
jgi:hypothetical protein